MNQNLKQPDRQGLGSLLVGLTEFVQAWSKKMEVLEASDESQERAIRDLKNRVQELEDSQNYRSGFQDDEHQELLNMVYVGSNSGDSVADAIERDYAKERGIRQE